MTGMDSPKLHRVVGGHASTDATVDDLPPLPANLMEARIVEVWGVTTDPLVFLRAALDAAQAEAEAATKGPWETEGDDPTDDTVYSVCENPDLVGQQVAFTRGPQSYDNMVHIARHDPAAVLRRIAADRKILAMHPMTDDVRDVRITRFGCQTCHRWDDRAEGRGYCDTIIALAEGWGWTED